MPAIGISRPKTDGAHMPTTPEDGTTFGSASRGTPSTSSIFSSQSSFWMSKSIVRDAFETSVTKLLPSVSEKISHASTVPRRSRPCRASSRARGTLSRIHFIFVPEKYGSMSRPVVLWM